MAVTVEEKEVAKSVVSTFSPEEQTQFKKQFNTSDLATQEKVIKRLVERSGGTQVATIEPEPSTPESAFDKFRNAVSPNIEGVPRRSITSDVLGGLTGMTGGLVQGTAEEAYKRFTGKEIELPRGSKEFRFLGAFAPGGVATRGALGAAKLIPGATKTAKFARPLVAGAVGGLLTDPLSQKDPGLALGNRSVQAAIAAPISGLVSGATEVGKNLVASGKAQNLIKAIKRRVTSIRTKGAVDKVRSDKTVQQLQQANKEIVQNERVILEADIKKAATEFGDEVVNKAPVIRDKAAQSLSKVTTRYGERFSDIIDSANVQAKATGKPFAGVNRSKLSGIEDDVIDELAEIGITDTATINRVKGITKAFGKVEPPTTPKQSISDAITGKQPKVVAKDPLIDLQKIKDVNTNLRQSLSSGSKYGTGPAVKDDIAVAIYRKKLSGILRDELGDDFATLQGDYSDFVDLQKFIFKKFRPTSGKYDDKAAVRFLKDIGLDTAEKRKLSAGDIQLMKDIENGTVLFPGIGKETASVKATGQALTKAQSQMANRLRDLNNKTSAELTKVKNEIKNIGTRNRARIALLNQKASQLEEMTGAIKMVQKSGTSAAFAVIDGVILIALYKTLFAPFMNR